MTTTEVLDNDVVRDTALDTKLEVVVLPVSDIDRATAFYRKLGWRQDVTPPGFVQFTPHGSSTSVLFGPNAATAAAPGSSQGWLVVADVVAARNALVAAGVDVGDVYHLGASGPVNGLAPERGSYQSLANFSDPDGNLWVLQEVTTRLPGRVDAAATSFGSVSDLATALRRAETAHGEHEKRTGRHDENWPEWYAAYVVAEQAGTQLPE